MTGSGQISNSDHWILCSISLCLQPLGPWGEALGPDTWTARLLHRAAPGLPHGPQMLSAGRGESQGLDCPSPLPAGKLQKSALFSKASTKPVPGRSGHRDSWPIRDNARENQETGCRVFKGSLTYSGYLMPPGYCGPAQSSRP